MSKGKRPSLKKVATTKFEAFEPMEMIQPEAFIEHAKSAYRTLRVVNQMFCLDPQELAKLLLSGSETPDGMIGACQDITDTKEWFQGFANVLNAMEARCIVAMAIVATGKAGAL